MKKKTIGLVFLGLLVIVFIANTIEKVKEKQEEEDRQYQALLESLFSSEEVEEGLEVGTIPPDFELSTLDGKKLRLSDFHGKKVLLNFWASWCDPCKEEMPDLQSFYDEKAKNYNVEIVAVNLTHLEKGGNYKEKIETFIEKYGLTFPVPLDEKGNVQKQYRVFAIPTSYIIGSNGVIQDKVIGPMDKKMLEQLFSDVH